MKYSTKDLSLYSYEEMNEVIESILTFFINRDIGIDSLFKIFDYPNYEENLSKLENVCEVIKTLNYIPASFSILRENINTKEALINNCIDMLIDFEFFKQEIKFKDMNTIKNEEKKLQIQKKNYSTFIKKIENEYQKLKVFLKSKVDIELNIPIYPNDSYKNYHFIFVTMYLIKKEDSKKILNILLNPNNKVYETSYNEDREKPLISTKEHKKKMAELIQILKERESRMKIKDNYLTKIKSM